MANLNLLGLEESGVSYGIEGLKILIYGGNTLGKTPQAMRFPKPLLLMGEAGGTAIKGYKVPIKQKKDFVDVVKQLTDEKTMEQMKEKFQTIVVDTATDIIEIYANATAREYGVRDVSEMNADSSLPNGYALYRTAFKSDINKLCSCGYTVIFIMHEELVEVKEQQVVGGKIKAVGSGVFKIVPKGSNSVKDSARFLKDMCDFRFYIKGNGVDETTGKTIMSTAYAHETAEYYAGSRFDIQPIINPFTAENLIEAMKEAQKRSAENYGADLVSFTMDSNGYTKQDYLDCIEPYVTALFELYPEEVEDIIYKQLGEGVRISEAKESQLVELETIYNNLVAFARERNIEV